MLTGSAKPGVPGLPTMIAPYTLIRLTDTSNSMVPITIVGKYFSNLENTGSRMK